MRRLVMALLLGSAALAAGEAHAQLIVPNWYGTYTYIHPSRMNPWANVRIPGTVTQGPFGTSWLGADGQIHGNYVDPMTGDMHAYGPGGKSYSPSSRTSPGMSYRQPTSRPHQTTPYHATPHPGYRRVR